MDKIPEPLWLDILRNVPIVCVDVVVMCENLALLVRRKHPPAVGEWWLPGGRVKKGELLADAAWRKAEEEIGLDCFVGPVVHTAETVFEDGPGGVPVHSVNTCFLLLAAQYDEIRPDYSIDMWTWIDCVSGDWWQNSYPEPKLHTYVLDCLKGAGLP